jgi:hypothetical protein
MEDDDIKEDEDENDDIEEDEGENEDEDNYAEHEVK